MSLYYSATSTLQVMPVGQTDPGTYYIAMQPTTNGRTNAVYAGGAATYNAQTGTLTTNTLTTGTLNLSGAIYVNGGQGATGQFLSSTGNGLKWVALSANSISNGSSNVQISSVGGSITMGAGGGPGLTYDASGNLTIGGNLTVLGTTTTVVNETAQGSIVPSANITYNLGSPTAYFGTIYAGQCTVNTVTATSLGGTLTTASQPNITTLAGVTSIGASGSTTLTGTLQTASQTNITAVGTLTGLTVSGAIVPNGNVTINLGSTTAWWNNIYGTAVHSLYADLAENYRADKPYLPGTVVQFGGVAEVTQAEADTTRVAGVVSTNPAHLMNGGLQGADVVPVALTGRVPCFVIGPVAKGDILVSAGFGYAKVNNNPAPGQAIGKALEDFVSQAKAQIEVVVGKI